MLTDGDHRQPVFLAALRLLTAMVFFESAVPGLRVRASWTSLGVAAPVRTKKADGIRFRALTVADLTTSSTHTEESADDLMCGVCVEGQHFEVLTGFEFRREEFPTLVGPAVDVKNMVKKIEDASSAFCHYNKETASRNENYPSSHKLKGPLFEREKICNFHRNYNLYLF